MKITTFTKSGRYYATVLSNFFNNFDHNLNSFQEIKELFIITAQRLSIKNTLKNQKDTFYYELCKAWHQIEKNPLKTSYPQWKVILKYGQEIIPDFKVYQCLNDPQKLFFLVPENISGIPESWIITVFRYLSIWYQINKGDILFHASGVVRKNQAFLFLGPSGAGKSTIAHLSSLCGFPVLHGDRILLRMSENKIYWASDLLLSKPPVPLKAVVFIHQSKRNRLLPISSVTTAKKLFENFPEKERALFSSHQFSRNYFTSCCSVARTIPGYDLYFRKSSDFWNLIDARL